MKAMLNYDNFCSTFVYGPIYNGEEVDSSKNHPQFKTKVQKPWPIYAQND